jgi:hypothetical protein
MPNPGRTAALAVALMLLLGAEPAFAARPAASIRIVPSTVQAGGAVTLSGSHLAPGRYFTLILAVPNAAHAEIRVFIRPAVKSDSLGAIRAHIRIPRMLLCGPAQLVAFAPPKGPSVTTGLRLIGCKKVKGAPPPPPPPRP